MPQIQVLPKVAGFGERLGQALGGGIGEGISQRLQQYHQQKQNKQTLQGLRPFLEQMEFTPEQISQFEESGLPAQVAAPLIGQIGKQFATQRMALQKQQQETSEKLATEQEQQEEWQDLFKSLREKIPYVGAPVGKAFLAHIPTSEAAKQREKYDVLAFQLERYARAQHTKGALSTKVYQSLLSKLPDSKLSEKQNLGRIEAWEESLLKNKGKVTESKEFKIGQTFESLPPASQVPNGIVSKGNKRYLSDGKTWKEIK